MAQLTQSLCKDFVSLPLNDSLARVTRFVGTAIWPSSLPFIYVLVLLCSVSEAQVNNVTGDQAPPIPGAGHDYVHLLNETVNPATGSVSIRINLPVPPSRGLTVPFS